MLLYVRAHACGRWTRPPRAGGDDSDSEVGQRFRVRVSLGEPAYSKEGVGRGPVGLGRTPPPSTQTLPKNLNQKRRKCGVA